MPNPDFYISRMQGTAEVYVVNAINKKWKSILQNPISSAHTSKTHSL
jgi:hypothetical protein